MKFVKAKSAGFCFGVKRAIDEAYATLKKENKKVYSIGPLIHNEIVTSDLKSKGLIEINDIETIKSLHDEIVIIRTHGIEKAVYETLKKNGNKIIDLTCPFVSKIHDLVKDYSSKGYKIIVVGDKNHPEVKGIVSYAANDIYVVITKEDIERLSIEKNDQVLVLFQTTTSVDGAQKLVDILKKVFYNITIKNTICNATETRQDEVRDLAKVSDAMFIIGSKTSSNTHKLYDIAREYCNRTYLLNSKEELLGIDLDGINSIGVSAGASTPEYLIEEILENGRNEF